ncbi:MAG: phosphatidylglycerophosphatase A [Vicinamibacterales bacterium]
MSRLALAFATSFGVGYAPVAPGTFGSAAGLLVWAVLPASPAAQVLAAAAVLALGVWAAGVTERHVRATDPGIVVIDEVLGMLVTLAFNPVSWAGAAVGFVLFRAFDVIKPYPANRLERLHGGLGIMMDDAMAGVYANVVLKLALALIPALRP